MSHLSPSDSEYNKAINNNLWEYVQSMNPQTVAKLSKPASHDMPEVLIRSVAAVLGNLLHGNPEEIITTSRDELGMILGAAMVDGYFLRNVEQRMELEKALQLVDNLAPGN